VAYKEKASPVMIRRGVSCDALLRVNLVAQLDRPAEAEMVPVVMREAEHLQ
jgi:hypothetical protein